MIDVPKVQERAKGMQMTVFLRIDDVARGSISFQSTRLDHVLAADNIQAIDSLAEEVERLRAYTHGLEMQLANADAFLSQVEQTEWVERVRSHTRYGVIVS